MAKSNYYIYKYKFNKFFRGDYRFTSDIFYQHMQINER